MRPPDRREVTLLIGFAAVVIAAAAIRSWPVAYAVLRAQGRVDDRCTVTLTWASRTRFAAEDTDAMRTKRQPSDAIPDAGLVRWETPNGPIWTPNADDVGGQMAGIFFRNPRWTPIDGSDVIPVRQGDVVMDAGAHLGESTRYALHLGASFVVAIEPVPQNLQALRRNLATEVAGGRIVVIDKGVYDREGFLMFERGHSWDGWFHEDNDSHGNHQGDRLPVTTIDAIVAELKLTRLDFIKMDIEGSEPYALRGARETLRRFKPRLAIGTYHRPGDLEEIHRIVLQANPEYRELPSRCLVFNGRLFPNLLFFY
jgi:FkbM family methyltransferase